MKLSPCHVHARVFFFLATLAFPLAAELERADFQQLELGPVDGQGRWSYAGGSPLPQEEVFVAPGGLHWIGGDKGIIPGGTQYLRARAGLDGNGRMTHWLSFARDEREGSVYVRFLLRLEERPTGVFSFEDYEMFFGFAAGAGAPWDAYVGLKHPATGEIRVGTLEATRSGDPRESEKLVLGETMLLVTRFTVNDDDALTAVDVWLNPASNEGETPDLSVSFDEPGAILGELTHFNFLARNMPMALDHLVFADSWEDVVPPAHDGTARPPVVLVPPASPEGEIGEIGELFVLVWEEPGNPVTGHQWVLNGTTDIPPGFGGTANPFPFEFSTSFGAVNPVRLAARNPDEGRAGNAINVRVSNAVGETTTPLVRIRESRSPEPPEITAQPRGTAAMEGDTVVLSVGVFSILDVTHQWFFDGEAIVGATNGTLTLPSFSEADAGAYHVEVTNDLGTTPSNEAVITFDDGSFPEDARVVRLGRVDTLGEHIAAEGQVDDQTGGELSPHDPADEPPTVASMSVEVFNGRISGAHADGRGGVFDFAPENVALVSGRPLTPEEENSRQIGFIGKLLLDVGSREIPVVPIVRDTGGHGFAGRDTLLPPNFLAPTGLVPRYPADGGDPNTATISIPDEGPPDFEYPGHDHGKALPSSPDFALAGSSYLKLVFDPADKVELAGFVFVNRDYFQSHRETKAFPAKPNIRTTARFSNGLETVTLISTGTTRQPGGLGHNTFFGFESPDEGYYLIELETWALGNNFRCHFSIDDLAIAVAETNGAPPGPMETWLASVGVPAERAGPLDRHGPLNLANLAAYAMGIPPYAATAADLPRTESVPTDTGTVAFHYRVNTAAEGVALFIEHSPDLGPGNWQTASPLSNTLRSFADGIEWREATFAIGPGEPLFLRLRAETAE